MLNKGSRFAKVSPGEYNYYGKMLLKDLFRIHIGNNQF